MAKLIGIDLGTANTVICIKGSGIVLREPSMIAFRESDHQVVAVGTAAREMLGKTPPSVRVERPLRNGVITDPDIATRMLREFYKRIEANTLLSRPDVRICTPCGITPVERNAVIDVARDAGARDVKLVEEPLAGAIGSGMNIDTARGSMIVDIGGGTTEIAVLCSRGIAVARTINVAGYAVDSAIMRYMRYRRGILIGERAAEDIKIGVGSAHRSLNAKVPYQVYGRSVRGNLTMTTTVESKELCPYIQEPLKQIIDAIRKTLQDTPPELASDVYDRGIMLTGGTSQIVGFSRLIYEATELRVVRARNPLDTVCLGLSSIIESEGDLSGSRASGRLFGASLFRLEEEDKKKRGGLFGRGKQKPQNDTAGGARK